MIVSRPKHRPRKADPHKARRDPLDPKPGTTIVTVPYQTTGMAAGRAQVRLPAPPWEDTPRHPATTIGE